MKVELAVSALNHNPTPDLEEIEKICRAKFNSHFAQLEEQSKAWAGEAWAGKGRDTRYVDLTSEILINPDALPIITTSMLESRIPEFEWDHGHSGKIVSAEIAEKLEALWESYIVQHGDLLREKADSTAEYNDKIYWKQK